MRGLVAVAVLMLIYYIASRVIGQLVAYVMTYLIAIITMDLE